MSYTRYCCFMFLIAFCLFSFNDPYQMGRDALRERNYQQAVAHFQKYLDGGGDQEDGALYWKAFAQVRINRFQDAGMTLARLLEQFPESRWANDGKALQMEIQQQLGVATSPEQYENQDLKLLALSGLLHQDPEKAIPMAQNLLIGSATRDFREQVFALLSSSSHPLAQEYVVETAKGKKLGEFQEQAILRLGVSENAGSMKILQEIYQGSQSTEIRQQVVQSFFIAHQAETLQSLFPNEQDEEVRASIITYLGLLDQAKYLMEIYSGAKNPTLAKKVLEALGISKQKQYLKELIRSEKDQDLQITAIRSLGMAGDCEGLAQIFSESTNRDLQSAVLEANLIAGNCDLVSKVIHDPKANKEIRIKAIEVLALGQNVETTLKTLYQDESDPDLRSAAINGLFSCGGIESLIEIARTETDQELKTQAVRMLSLSRSARARAFMLELLEQ